MAGEQLSVDEVTRSEEIWVKVAAGLLQVAGAFLRLVARSL